MASPTQTRPKAPAGPSRHVYDVIVLGGQLGGALAATLLAKRGVKVLLVEHEGTGAGYEHGGWLLPYAPFLLPPVRSMPAVEQAVGELNLGVPLQRTLRPHHPELQLALSDRRVDLHGDERRRTAELARAFGEAAGAALDSRLSAMAALHDRSDPFFMKLLPLPPDGLMDRWRLERETAASPGLSVPPALDAGEPADALLLGLLRFVSNLHAPSAPVARARPLSQVLEGPLFVPGGREGLRELLLRRFLELGGEVVGPPAGDAYVVEHLAFEGRRLAGVKLLRAETVYRADAVVAALDSGALRRLVTDKKHHHALTEQLDLSTTRELLFPLNWVVPERALPRGMGELLLADTGDAELGPLLLQLHPARRPTGEEEPGLRVVCAGAFVPASARELGEEHLQGLVERLAVQLEALMPFTRSHVLLQSAPYLHASGVRGSRLLPHPLFSFETEPALGVGGLKQRTSVKNLVLASREVLPGLGVEGEFMAGIRAASLVQELLQKRSPL
ncbi:MAG: desaturase [Myxococcaceae bacterium]|nr:desaturase [Myxococcaceae bacterium]